MKWLYVIKNEISGKEYIGVTIDPDRRWRQHKLMRTKCSALKDAMKKYGVDNFTFSLLCGGEDSYIDELEVKAIDVFNTQVPNGYNLTLGGDGTNYTKWDDSWNCLLGTKPDKVLGEELGVGQYVVNARRNGLGIRSYRENNITNWEDVLHLLGTTKDSDIAEILGLTPNAVYNKRKELNIPPYTPQSERHEYPQELIDLLGKVPDSILSERYDIPYSALSQKRVSLGIKKVPKGERVGWRKIDWDEEDVCVLKDTSLKDKEVAEILGRSTSTISRERKSRGIKFNKTPLSHSNIKYLVEDEDHYLQDLLDKTLTNRVISDRYNIPVSSVIHRRKVLGITDYARTRNKPLKPWSEEELSKLWLPISDKEVSLLINRGEDSVRMKRREVGVPKRRKPSPEFLHDKENLEIILDRSNSLKYLAELFKVTASQISDVRRKYK